MRISSPLDYFIQSIEAALLTYDPTVLHLHHPVRKLRQLQVVRDKHQRPMTKLRRHLQKPRHILPILRIQIARG